MLSISIDILFIPFRLTREGSRVDRSFKGHVALLLVRRRRHHPFQQYLQELFLGKSQNRYPLLRHWHHYHPLHSVELMH